MLAALIVAVVGVVIAIGWKLPAEHRITREAELPHGPDAVWTAISDFPALPAWMPGIRRVQRLDALEGRDRWLYETAEGDMTIEVVTRFAPTELTIRSVNSDLAFGGTWTHRISPVATGSLVTITEHGWISNPYFRFMYRYVFAHTTTPDETLSALRHHLGGGVPTSASRPSME
jgi:hypothetical protein